MEDFEITVDKANEVEVAIFDKQVSETHPVPIGLLWIKISDLVEAQRKQKVMMETGQGGWVTAHAMDGDGATSPRGGQTGDMNSPIGYGDNRTMTQAATTSGFSEGVDAWFAVEPAGAIALQLNFGKYRGTSVVLLLTCHSQGERAKAAARRAWRTGTTGCGSQAEG